MEPSWDEGPQGSVPGVPDEAGGEPKLRRTTGADTGCRSTSDGRGRARGRRLGIGGCCLLLIVLRRGGIRGRRREEGLNRLSIFGAKHPSEASEWPNLFGGNRTSVPSVPALVARRFRSSLVLHALVITFLKLNLLVDGVQGCMTAGSTTNEFPTPLLGDVVPPHFLSVFVTFFGLTLLLAATTSRYLHHPHLTRPYVLGCTRPSSHRS